MEQASGRRMRQDASRNRELLLDAARALFAERGSAVALEEVAALAGVSRTTLHRNFASRHDLAVTVFQDNVERIEAEAERLQGRPDGAVRLLDFVLEMQLRNRGIGSVLAADVDLLRDLGARTQAAFVPLVRTSRAAGTLRPGVTAPDFFLAVQMAEGGLLDDDPAVRAAAFHRIRRMLHRSLFTDPD